MQPPTSNKKKYFALAIAVVVVLIIIITLIVVFTGDSTPTPGATPAPSSAPGATPAPSSAPGATPAATREAHYRCAPTTPSNRSSWGILGRNSGGTIRCLTTDGKNCHWFGSENQCETRLGQLGNPPYGAAMDCGSAIMRDNWGPTISSGSNAWCMDRNDL